MPTYDCRLTVHQVVEAPDRAAAFRHALGAALRLQEQDLLGWAAIALDVWEDEAKPDTPDVGQG
ncbi:MAG TPA: hypothetical protein VFD49_09100 [Candidatus Dormibacteraeota bacterium]|nr:hypothetical protein [Candidatus Dormibacteraeota bacterium]